MTVPPVVDVHWLHKNAINVKILHVSCAVTPKPDWREFKIQKSGKFEQLLAEKSTPTELIPEAGFFDFSVAYYPGEFQRFSLYSPDKFQEYIRLLGIDFYDHVVVYSSGPASGMLFASRAWWTFRLYGHSNVSVLNGGLDAWKGAGFGTTIEVSRGRTGNWKAKPIDRSLLAEFNELDFYHLENINYLDARPREQFIGEQPLGVPAPESTGSHIQGSISLPLSEVMTQSGLKNKDAIRKALEVVGFRIDRPIVTACVTGVQASLLSLALFTAGYKAKVFNGSLTEVAGRDSSLINEKQ